jgi:hypothetical protein
VNCDNSIRYFPLTLRLRRDRFMKLWCTIRTCSERGELPMSLSSHVEELKKKHQALSKQVEEAQRAPGSSDLEIAELKKQKLRLKEEIERLGERA